MNNYSEFHKNIFSNTEILENVKVFAKRQTTTMTLPMTQGYDNTSTFSSKTAELTKLNANFDVKVDEQRGA